MGRSRREEVLMFAKFNLKLTENQISKEYGKDGIGQKDILEEKVHQVIDRYLLREDSLDAAAIEEDWFPEINAHVFLSHSHKDEKAVINLAGYLYQEYGITSFIDSTVWGYADNLLKMIDKRYCVDSKDKYGNIMYSYEKRNRTTAQVHLLLQGALAKMINRCECLIFVNTPNSLKITDVQSDTITASPWIYSEILMASTFPGRPLREYRLDELTHFNEEVIYKMDLTGFVDLSVEDFAKAKEKTVIDTPEKILERLYYDKSILK